jgi:isoaspartyl peptidase/L-asparaginase-like protein (Ntn-hydrolase superfamily)
MGFKLESLTTSRSISLYEDWKQNNCQPNFWTHVVPDPSKHCGPYRPIQEYDENTNPSFYEIDSRFHDTIGMIAIDRNKNIAVGTSTNGATHKIPGRVGDSALPGSGAYAENSVGAAAATGDGDILMRFLPSFLAVEYLRTGSTPEVAGQRALIRIGKFYPKYVGAIVVVDKDGNYGAACHGIDFFPYSVFHPRTKTVSVNKVKCTRSI